MHLNITFKPYIYVHGNIITSWNALSKFIFLWFF